MNKNTVITILLSTAIIFGAMVIQNTYFPQKPATATKTEAQSKEASSTTAKVEALAVEPAVSLAIEAEDDAKDLYEQTTVLETDLMRAVFTNKGGDLVSLRLKEHNAAASSEKVEMLEQITAQNRAFSLALGGAESPALNQLFHVKKNEDGKKKSIVFYRDISLRAENGTATSFRLIKEYNFLQNDYMFELRVSVEGAEGMSGLNIDGLAYTLRTAPQIGPEWNVDKDRYEFRYFYSYVDGSKKYTKVKAGQTAELNSPATWTAVTGKYFAMIVVPETPVQSLHFSALNPQKLPLHQSQIFLTRAAFSTQKNTDVYRIYVGPSSERYLSKYNLPNENAYGLDNSAIDTVAASSKFWGPLEAVLKWFLELFYKIIPNWGVSILLLTLLLRILLFPLTKKGSEGTKKMQEYQPQVKAIQDKYKNNPQKMQAELGKFYKEVGYNPMSGCLPLLIQFPLLYAMFRLFNNYFEFRGASFIPGWIPDLSIGDSIFKLGFSLPILHWTDIRLLPLIYMVSQLLFSKITQPQATTQQSGGVNTKVLLYGMPIMFFFLFYNAPSGLLLYWIASNVLALGQQLIINKMMSKK